MAGGKTGITTVRNSTKDVTLPNPLKTVYINSTTLTNGMSVYDNTGTDTGYKVTSISNNSFDIGNYTLALTPKYLDTYSGYYVTDYIVSDSDNNVLFESDGSMGTQNIWFNPNKSIIISNLISGNPATSGLGCWGYTGTNCTVTPTGSGYYSQLTLTNFTSSTPTIEIVWGYGPVKGDSPIK